MIQIAVCDDQTVYRNQFIDKVISICAVKLPDQYDFRECIGFANAKEVVAFLRNNKIDILFLDIEMNGINGFELASVLNREFPDIIIIFISAYENYVYSAFEYAPFRFLRKSHINEELEDALVAAIDKLMSLQKTMVFHTVDRYIELRLKSIIYFESSGNYLLLHHNGEEIYRIRSTVTEISEKLKADDFVRIHHAYVINLDNIHRTAGYTYVVMNDGTRLPISARRMKEFKNAYMDFTNRRFI